MKLSLIIFTIAGTCVATSAIAQHHAPAPYAGQQSREIKALSEEEVKGLHGGAGLGFAKAAELNRYPGPMHALELGDSLGLSAGQRESLETLMKAHKVEARTLGERVVALERELDTLFADRRATAAGVDALLARIGEASARLRGEHLKTHIATRAMLTPAQVDRYVELRGYAQPGVAGHRH